MALKDVSKIVANEVKRDALRDSVAALPEPQTVAGRQFSEETSKLAKTIKPFTSKPDDVSGHKGLKLDMKNPFHKDLLEHLYKNGDAGDLTFHEGGAVSLPREVAYNEKNSSKFEVAARTGGGEKSYSGLTPKPSTAVTPAPRKSEKASTKPGIRPAAPRPTKPVSPVKAVADNLASDPKSEIASLFVGAGVRVSKESIELENKRKADAEAADKAERLRLRKERLAED
jgi:hypothetical protein